MATLMQPEYAIYGPERSRVVHRVLAQRVTALCGFRARLGWFDVRATYIPGHQDCLRCLAVLGRMADAP